MDYKATGFPFTIMDVASLLRLNIRREGSGHIYVDCPICGDRRGKMNLNLTKNVWRCNYCGEGGGMLALYAKVYRISNSDAYKEICDALQTGSAASAYSTPSPAGPNKEMPQAERASEQEIHRTFTTMMSALSLTSAHREHLRSKLRSTSLVSRAPLPRNSAAYWQGSWRSLDTGSKVSRVST